MRRIIIIIIIIQIMKITNEIGRKIWKESAAKKKKW